MSCCFGVSCVLSENMQPGEQREETSGRQDVTEADVRGGKRQEGGMMRTKGSGMKKIKQQNKVGHKGNLKGDD